MYSKPGSWTSTLVLRRGSTRAPSGSSRAVAGARLLRRGRPRAASGPSPAVAWSLGWSSISRSVMPWWRRGSYATRVLLLTSTIWRIRLIRIPPKSLLLLLHRIINMVIKISWVCTLIIRYVRSSLFKLPSRWALSMHALLLICHDRTIHLDVVKA